MNTLEILFWIGLGVAIGGLLGILYGVWHMVRINQIEQQEHARMVRAAARAAWRANKRWVGPT